MSPGTQVRAFKTTLALCLALLAPVEAWAERPSGAPPDWPSPIHDDAVYGMVLVEQLEYRGLGGEDALAWIVSAWVGPDYHRLWVETEGEHALGTEEVELETLDVMYGRVLSAFWDLQLGLGYQRSWVAGPDPDRLYAVVGIQGLAPQWFELEARVRVSQEGDVSATLEAEYELVLTQRLVLQPRLETAVAIQSVEAFGVGSGLNDLRLGARLRYEIWRELAPYLGVTWLQRFGETADLARDEGAPVSDVALVAGVRVWW